MNAPGCCEIKGTGRIRKWSKETLKIYQKKMVVFSLIFYTGHDHEVKSWRKKESFIFSVA